MRCNTLIYKDSILYKLNSKRVLQYRLKITNRSFFKQDYVAQLIHPYIENKNGKKRLIEAPDRNLKVIQTRLKNILLRLNYPEYVFSGVKFRSYPDNAKLHIGNKYLYKIDLTAFFPSIAREKVFDFFKRKLCVSSDIAKILTNFTTIDLDKCSTDKLEKVNLFLKEKGIKTRNHLISGSPASQLLSYLANQDMFDRLHQLSKNNGVTMSIYVDDIVFSSDNYISSHFKLMIKRVINSEHYRLSAHKTKLHTRYYPKKVTGAIINKDGNLSIPNSMRERIVDKCKSLKNNPENEQCRRKLRGLVEAARQINPGIYPSIYKLAYDPQYKISNINKT